MTDALSQVKTYAYAEDDRLSGVTYAGAVNPPPNVSFTYDPYIPRLIGIGAVAPAATLEEACCQHTSGRRDPYRISITRLPHAMRLIPLRRRIVWRICCNAAIEVRVEQA